MPSLTSKQSSWFHTCPSHAGVKAAPPRHRSLRAHPCGRLAVMDPDGVAVREIEPVSVEGGQVEQIVAVGVRPSVVDARVPHLEVRHAASEEGPVGRLAEVQPLHQNVVRLQHGEQPRPILLPAHSSSARVNGVSSQLPRLLVVNLRR